ncbi:hypothetical protein Smic_57010 [Streptomyces microflavus]|uniref:Uncharacterized protein n=1 Tax=Streptomyces microflavus TaxID=1919 RepID=A0A7J0CZH4_STRMI|nr:hypothetical protein Smic_57010 [Streptomyces microflavus]
MLYVAVEGHHPLRKATTLATLAAVLDEEVPPPVRAGALAPVLTALLTRDIPARPDAAALDRMLAEAASPQPAPTPGAPTGRPAPPPAPSPHHPPGRPTRRPLPPGSATRRPSPPRRRVEQPVREQPVRDPDHVPHCAPADSRTTSPSGSPPTPPSGSPTVSDDEARRRRILRRTRMITTASSVVSAAVLAGVILWMTDPPLFGGDGDDGAKGSNRPDTTASAPANGRSAAPPTAGGQPVADGDESGADDDEPEAPVDLLTPQGARQAIAALKPLMGGTKVTDFTLYDEHASAQAPLKSNSRLYDRFSYRDGQAKNDDMGGTLMSGDKPVDLNSVDWDALPALLRTARTTLNIPEPESSYVIVDPSSPFHDDRPVLRVYVSDKYGGAFLTAHLDGRVIEKNPREKG